MIFTASSAVPTTLLSYLHGRQEEGSSGKYESENSQHYGQHFVVADVRAKRYECNTFRWGDAGVAARRRFNRLDVGISTVHYYLKISCSCLCAVLAGKGRGWGYSVLEFQAENTHIMRFVQIYKTFVQ